MASPNNLYLASHRGFSVLLFLAAAVLGGAEELYAAPTFEITQGEPGPPIVGLTRNRTLGSAGSGESTARGFGKTLAQKGISWLPKTVAISSSLMSRNS